MIEKTRNSPFREVSKIFYPLAKKLNDFGIKANQVTLAGTYLTGLGSLLKMSEKQFGTDFSFFALGLFVLGLTCDGLDGALARISGTADKEGAVYDLVNDRVQELLLTTTRIANASERRDILGVIAATLAGLTNPLPSYIRAMVEAKGGCVPETGKNPLSFLGTRAPRTGLAILATCFPEVAIDYTKSPFQPIADLLITVGNVFSTAERLVELIKINNNHQLNNQLESEGNEQLKQLGQVKKEALEKFITFNTLTILALGTVGVLSILDRHKIL